MLVYLNPLQGIPSAYFGPYEVPSFNIFGTVKFRTFLIDDDLPKSKISKNGQLTTPNP